MKKYTTMPISHWREFQTDQLVENLIFARSLLGTRTTLEDVGKLVGQESVDAIALNDLGMTVLESQNILEDDIKKILFVLKERNYH